VHSVVINEIVQRRVRLVIGWVTVFELVKRIYNQPARPTQPSIPPWSANEDQLRLGRQRQVWIILFVDKLAGVQVKL